MLLHILLYVRYEMYVKYVPQNHKQNRGFHPYLLIQDTLLDTNVMVAVARDGFYNSK